MKQLICIVLLSLLLGYRGADATDSQSNQQNQESNRVERPEKERNQDIREAIKTPKDFGYKLPTQGRERQRTEFQGKRGGHKPFSLKILAPRDHIGKTMATHPEFWIQIAPIPKSPLQYNLMFEGQSIWQGEFVPTADLLALKLPEEFPPLSPGIYVLAVGHGCPQDCYAVRIAFEVVEEDQVLEEKVFSETDRETKIKLLAEGGYWFEAQSHIVEMVQKIN